MRLLWAVLLVVLPLVAEFATAQKCPGQPDAPEHASVRCFKKRGTCRASCDTGYIFPSKNSKMAIYDCEDGNWVMKGGEDRCTPVCKPPCKNGGYCSAPNTCTCHAGYEGASCELPHCDMECLNGGQCIAPNTCACPQQWTGTACELHYEMHTTEEPTEDPAAYEDEVEDEDIYEEEDEEHEEDGDDYENDEDSTDAPADEDEGEDDDHSHDHDGDGEEDHEHDVHADHGELDGDEDEDADDEAHDDAGDDETEGEDENGDDEEGEDEVGDAAAYGGVSEVVPKVLVGSAALLIVRAL